MKLNNPREQLVPWTFSFPQKKVHEICLFFTAPNEEIPLTGDSLRRGSDSGGGNREFHSWSPVPLRNDALSSLTRNLPLPPPHRALSSIVNYNRENTAFRDIKRTGARALNKVADIGEWHARPNACAGVWLMRHKGGCGPVPTAGRAYNSWSA